MSILQIQKPQTDTTHNNAEQYANMGGIFFDWKIVTVLCIFALTLWCFILAVAKSTCGYVEPCTAFLIVFWFPSAVLGITVIGIFIALIWYLINNARKSALANARYQHYNVSDAKLIYEKALEVALADAKSAATGQVDTLNVSVSGNMSAGKAVQTVIENPLQDKKAGLEDIFNFKEE